MTVPPALAAAVARAAGAEVTGGSRASGGSINEAWALELAGGGRAFVKTRADAAPGSGDPAPVVKIPPSKSLDRMNEATWLL